jgi:PAS domain S-box-containing protein
VEHLRRAPLARYLAAVLCALIGVVAKMALEPVWGERLPLLTFFPAVALAAWFGGFGPGLLTTMLCSAAGADYGVLPTRSLRLHDSADVIALAVFAAIGILLSALNEALHRGRQQVAALIDHALDAVIVADREGRIITWNPRAEELFGWSRHEVMGQSLADTIVPASLREAHRRGIERYHATGEGPVLNRLIELQARRRDGTEIPVEIAITPVRLGRRVIFSAFLRDISERKRVEAERAALLGHEQTARAEADAANRAKDEFLAVLSHELRTPLNAVYGWARMLRAGELRKAAEERALEAIERNANAQVQLIDDLLDVSRIVTGKLRLTVRPVDLRAVVEAALDTVRPAAEAKGIRIQSVLDSRAASMTGDPDRLQQVVWNLLMNAVKFTPRGGQIQAHLQRVDSHVEIVVSDTGQGIAPEILPFVFDRFRQGDSSSTRTHTGLGLGLALVKHLVELHGGTVVAHSAGEGQGATFIVKLPLSIAQIPDAPIPRVHPTATSTVFRAPAARLDGLRVLVVDDDPDALELARSILSKAGAAVTTCRSAQEALELFQQERPEVLVSDIEMPEEDGYSLIRKVRALDVAQGGRTPAVALTAYGRMEDRVRTLASGYSMHVPKPVDPGELTAIIASVAGRTVGH